MFLAEHQQLIHCSEAIWLWALLGFWPVALVGSGQKVRMLIKQILVTQTVKEKERASLPPVITEMCLYVKNQFRRQDRLWKPYLGSGVNFACSACQLDTALSCNPVACSALPGP